MMSKNFLRPLSAAVASMAVASLFVASTSFADTTTTGATTTGTGLTMTRTPTVKLYDCSVALTKPQQVVIACADANRYLSGLTWTNWGKANATAKGVLHWNLCTPNCASGKFRTKKITLTATDRRKVKGVWLYTELKGPSGSWGEKGTVWTLPTAGV